MSKTNQEAVIDYQLTNEDKIIIEMLQGAMDSTPTGVSFFSIKNYTNKNGAVSNYRINIGVDYENAKKKDIEFLSNLDVSEIDTTIDSVLLEQARVELLDKLKSPNKVRKQGQENAYTALNDAVKIKDGKLYVYGALTHKEVLVEGVYKDVKSSPLTIAKNKIGSMMRTKKMRNFKISDKPEDIMLSGNSETILVEFT